MSSEDENERNQVLKKSSVPIGMGEGCGNRMEKNQPREEISQAVFLRRWKVKNQRYQREKVGRV